jgi:hypothetical protein
MTNSPSKTKAIARNRASGLRFEDDRLIVAFRDGREMHVPLKLYPTLLRATPSQRADWDNDRHRQRVSLGGTRFGSVG